MHYMYRLLFFACSLLLYTAATAQSSGLYWFGSLASQGQYMLTDDGRVTGFGSGYNGPHNYFVTMDEAAQVQSFTTHSIVGRTSSSTRVILTLEGHLLRAMNTTRPGTNIPELVLCLTDVDHNILWTRSYTIPAYLGSLVDSQQLGWTHNGGFLIQVTFLDSNHTASARVNGLLLIDQEGAVVSARTGAELAKSITFDTLPGGDLLFGTSSRLTRTNAQWDAVWSKSYASGSVPQHTVRKPVDVGSVGEIRMLWNMGDTAFQLPSGGSPVWPTY